MLERLRKWWNKPGDEIAAALDGAFLAGRLAEREECAQLCDRHAKAHERASESAPTEEWREISVSQSLGASSCAAAIRARFNLI